MRQTKEQKERDRRVSLAINRLQIPLRELERVCKAAELAIDAGRPDDEVRACVEKVLEEVSR